jgi:hypothetical protein
MQRHDALACAGANNRKGITQRACWTDHGPVGEMAGSPVDRLRFRMACGMARSIIAVHAAASSDRETSQ